MEYLKTFNENKKPTSDESHEVYQKSLKDDYWNSVREVYPNIGRAEYNETDKAIDYVHDKMKEKYPDEDWLEISDDIKRIIGDGLC